MTPERVQEILDNIGEVAIAVYGDFALDAYWMLDPAGGEISVETGKPAQAVQRHYSTLGGAANVVANLAALQPRSIQVIGALGEDLFGRELVRQLQALGVNTDGVVIQQADFDTITFAKRYLADEEQPRIDFGFCNARSPATDDALLTALEDAIQETDAVIFNQQVPGSLNNQAFIDGANALFEQYRDQVIVLDSRHYGDRFNNIIRKCNDVEAAQLNGVDAEPDAVIPVDQLRDSAQNLYAQARKPLIITRGSRGMLVVDAEGVHAIPGIQLMKQLDPVGAGDTSLSAVSLCLAAGIAPADAAAFANFAAAVTVQKRFRTGTAAGEEILEVSKDPAYLYQPELAEHPRQAQYVADTEIESCVDPATLDLGHITHAVFDHDGTISVLRQGWEQIMEPVMMQAILGDRYASADQQLFAEVQNQVRDYIDQSTGIQTIVQMATLVELVKEFGIVPEEEILDKHGYKDMYNDALMELVHHRIAKFQSGQLDRRDYTIKGAVEFLQRVKNQGVTLYLASGTDRQDVENEASILGYADLFDGGIYGAMGDVDRYSKKRVIDEIIRENQLEGSELVVFGDGPVEIRECRKVQGIPVGVASDEVRRHGRNPAKRTRLIKAGAQLLVPDFSQGDALFDLLFKEGI
ncbi:MAG TPA: PfkB family carbohydrate kinase [bacterium]|nr:PfkB family carbohydrate kinase [bacterium]